MNGGEPAHCERHVRGVHPRRAHRSGRPDIVAASYRSSHFCLLLPLHIWLVRVAPADDLTLDSLTGSS